VKVQNRSGLGVDRLLPGWLVAPRPKRSHLIGVLPGEGVGPEVVAASLDVLAAIDGAGGARFDVRFGPEARPGTTDPSGSLGEAEHEFCRDVFDDGGAVFCGPRGGRFVYELRERFDLFCKLTPVEPLPALCGAGVVGEETARRARLVFVRENVGGLYFGSEHERREGGVLREVSHTFGYRRDEVDRIVELAVQLAAFRSGRLTVVVKGGGVPGISRLWREAAAAVEDAFDVVCEVLEVDNACYQIVADPARFDVLVSPNMFGDVLADVSALLLGSRGASFSGNFGAVRRAVYQTAHGAALDLAGRDVANPVGQILSLALLLEESFDRPDLARAVRVGADRALAEGWRTPDVAGPDCERVGTRELGKRIAEHVHEAVTGADA
jgi:3-isopropylmalate dehydrogenase